MNNPVPVQSVQRPAATMRALWSGLDAAATPALTLVTLAVLVRSLGATDYGILVIALAASGLSMAVNPAIAATTTKFVSELSGQPGTRDRSAAVITVSLSAVAVIDLVLLAATAVFSAPLSQWVFGPSVAASEHLGPVLMLAVLSIGIQQIEAVLSAAIKGLERFGAQAIIEVVSRAALTAVVISIAWYTRSIAAVLGAQCVAYFASMLVRAVALRRLLPGKRLLQRSNIPEAGRLLRYSGWMWLTALAGVAYGSADRLIVGRSLGAAAAGHYNIYLQIAQIIHFIPSSVFAFSLPAFSRLAAQGPGREEIRRTYRTYLKTISLITAAIAAAMMVSWPMLMQIFSGTRFTDSLTIPWLLTLNFLLLACNVAPYYLLIALGYAKTVSLVTTVSMLAALLLMAVLIPRYGLEGAAIARLAYGIGALMLLYSAERKLRRT